MTYKLFWKGEEIDEFDTFAEAKEMQTEYNITYGSGVSIEGVGMVLKFDVMAHEPLSDTGWETVETDVDLSPAVNLVRSWGAKGWAIKMVSSRVRLEEWESD